MEVREGMVRVGRPQDGWMVIAGANGDRVISGSGLGDAEGQSSDYKVMARNDSKC